MIDRFARSQHGYAYLTEGRTFPRQGEPIAFCADFAHDPVIESLWKSYIGLVGTQAPIDLVLLLVEQLKQVFGDFRQWTWIQATTNRAVHGYALDFILDTIRYTQTGKREYSLSTWSSLIQTDPALVNLEVKERIDLFDTVAIPSAVDLITEWLKHEDGVADMFHAAHILFGKVNH